MKFQLIKPTEIDDNYNLYLINNNQEKVASLSFTIIENNYQKTFKDIMSEDYFNETFENRDYLYLSELHVNKNHRRKGFANKILMKFFQLYDKNFKSKYPQIVLNASPMDMGISLSLLKKFYGKFMFSILYDSGKNAIMLRDSYLL